LRYRKYLTLSPGSVTRQMPTGLDILLRELAARADRNRLERSCGSQTSSLSSFREVGEALISLRVPVQFVCAHMDQFPPAVQQFALLLKKAAYLDTYLSYSVLVHCPMLQVLATQSLVNSGQFRNWRLSAAGEPGGGCIWFIVAQICAGLRRLTVDETAGFLDQNSWRL